MTHTEDRQTMFGPPPRWPDVSPEILGLRSMSAFTAAGVEADPNVLPTGGRAVAAVSTPAPEVHHLAATEPEPAADTAWATPFGATNVGNRPAAVAVSGTSIYVGGDFAGPMAGMPEHTYNRIARWDGKAWSRLGDGLDGSVNAITVVGNDVYVGGEFNIAGGKAVTRRLARWDGTTWSGVAGGVANSSVPSLAAVQALASDGDKLYVAGAVDSAGSGAGAVAAAGFAALALDTGRWETFDGGLGFLGGPGEGRALAVSGGRVYVGGYFDTAGRVAASSIAALDTRSGEWVPLGAGIRNGDFVGSVNSLAVDSASATLFIGGAFTAADSVATSGVATLNGDVFGSLGAFLRFGDASTASVFALAFAGGSLYAGGEFTTAGNAVSSYWAVHNGTEWAMPGDGVDNVVRSLAAVGDSVVVAGDFQYSGQRRMTFGGIWTGTCWQTFGQGVSYDPYADGNVFAVVPIGSGAYVGGYFDQAGPVRVGSVGEWTGSEWLPMAGGLSGATSLATVYAMAMIGEDLYVTGSFASAGAGAAANIARWDGTNWSALGTGLNGTGYALAVLAGRLYVGGRFSAAGGTAANGVAVWDPATSTWRAIGNAPAYDDSVLGLAVIFDRYLVIGGKYNAFRAGGRDLVRGLNGLCLFDTQAPPAPEDPLTGYLVLAGVQQSRGTGTVRALQVIGGDLFIGGTFDTAGVVQLADPPQLGFSASNLAVWHFGGDGAWTSPGGTDEPVMALATVDGTQLLIGGWFGATGPIAAAGVAEYVPETDGWTTFGSGIGPGERGVRHVEALAPNPLGGVWVGGTFNTAGGAPSCSLAFWGRSNPNE